MTDQNIVPDQDRLHSAWEQILNGREISRGGFIPVFDLVGAYNATVTGITHFARHEGFWMALLRTVQSMGLDQAKRLDVLVTASSVGAEVYDAARIAKTLGLRNIYFYGHDVSGLFIDRARDGIYPIAALQGVPQVETWFNLHCPYPDYAQVRMEHFDNVHFLNPSDIRDLKDDFDIAVENIMNPAPQNIVQLLCDRARHMALSSYAVVGVSDAFSGAVAPFRAFLADYCYRYRDYGGGLMERNAPQSPPQVLNRPDRNGSHWNDFR